MEVGSPEWIEASLARLDELETERGEHEAALESATDPATLKRHNDALERLETEIKSLYAQLESVAGDGEEGDEQDDEDDEDDTQADDELSAHRGASPAMAPVAAPMAAAAENPFGSPSAAPAASPFGSSGGGGFDAPAASIGYDDDVPKGGGAKWMFLGLVAVAGIGVGGYFVWQNMQAEKAKEQAKPAAVEEIKIDAASIREDTEAPNAAKGGDATISPTADGYPEGKSGGGGGGGGGGGKKTDGTKKKPLEIKSGKDPLGGGDPLG